MYFDCTDEALCVTEGDLGNFFGKRFPFNSN